MKAVMLAVWAKVDLCAVNLCSLENFCASWIWVEDGYLTFAVVKFHEPMGT